MYRISAWLNQGIKKSTSVSVRVPKEHVCLHPDLEFWTYTHCQQRLHLQFWALWTYFTDVKTYVWVLTETVIST